MNATQINQYINHDELCACRHWVRNTRPACDCGASEAQETVRRAVNSHEAAQRLAEALEGYERMSEKFTAISNPSREVVEQLQTALKFIAPATRAAIAEWEAVK